MSKFMNVSYSTWQRKWIVTLISKETGVELYESKQKILLHAMTECLQFVKDPDEIDNTDWAKATMGEIQKLLEGEDA